MSNSCEGNKQHRKGNCGDASNVDFKMKRKWHVHRRNVEHKAKKKNSSYSEDKYSTSSGSKSSEDQRTEEELEIPGFYYDKEKKKYFKILPDQSSIVSGIITQEVLRERRVEERRQKDLCHFSKPQNIISRQTWKKPICLCSNNLYHLNTARYVGLRSALLSKSVLNECYIKKLLLRSKIPVSNQYGEYSVCGDVEDVKKMIISPDATTLVCLWSVKELMSQQLRRIHIEPTRRRDAKGNIALTTRIGHHSHELGIMKIMSLCWAPNPCEIGRTSRILFTCTSLLENANNVACLSNLDSPEDDNNSYFNLNQTSWSCAWSSRGGQFAVGLETHCVLVDVETKKKSKLYCDSSAVYTIAMSQQSCRTMYTGTKKGTIFMHDLRGHFAHSQSDMTHKFGIAHIYLASDELSLTASDTSGKIKTWDLRQRKVIREFTGHVNQYVRQPFFVDAAENFLFAAGQDCYTRIWNYQSGSLLHTIPAPHPVSVQSIPQVVYSSHMGGPPGLPGLLLTSKGYFHLYAF